MHGKGGKTRRRGVVRHSVEDRYIDVVAAARSNKGEKRRGAFAPAGTTSARSRECGYRCHWHAGHSPDDYRTESLSRHAAASSSAGNAAARVSFVSLMLSEGGDGPLSDRSRLSDSGERGFFFYSRFGNDSALFLSNSSHFLETKENEDTLNFA